MKNLSLYLRPIRPLRKPSWIAQLRFMAAFKNNAKRTKSKYHERASIL